MQDGGWTQLKRGRVKGAGPAGCVTFAASALLVIAAFLTLGAMRVHPFLIFVILCVLLILVASGLSALADLIWGVGASVAVSREPVRAGETFKVRCTVSRPRNAHGLQVMWQGREEVVLRGYDDTVYDEAFLRKELFHALGETVSIEIAPDAMPSFRGKNARIIWSISVETHGRGGAMQADYPILVLPGRS